MSQKHWEQVYSSKAADEVSWFQRQPEVSLRLIEKYASLSSRVIDVGAGESLLVDQLMSRGYRELTLMDISSSALEDVKTRLGANADVVQFEVADVRHWQPSRTFDVWHDRAVFHFMNAEDDVRAYVQTLSSTVIPGGYAIIGTFAENGPIQCSGLDVRRYSVEQLAAVFSDDLSLIEAESEVHVTPWEAVQNFNWVVLCRR